MRLEDVLPLFPDLEAVEITSWVERGWVCPASGGGTWVFREIDVARVRLVRDLRREMEVEEETVPLVLSLLDQLYDVRRTLRGVARALEGQPEEVRAAVLKALQPEG
jgi:chaperone modulatory protein CbpM